MTSVGDTSTRSLFERADWGLTSLGHPDSWDSFLRGAVELCLNSPFPMTVALGDGPDELVNIYNDGYIPILSGKHPQAFGSRVADVYGEIWPDFLEERVERVLNGESISGQELLIPLSRESGTKEGYFDFTYSPVTDSTGRIRGALSVAAEVTETVLERRRSDIISALGQRLMQLGDLDAAKDEIASLLIADDRELSALTLIQHEPGTEAPVILISSSPDFAEETLALKIDWNRAVQKTDESTVVMTVLDEHNARDIGFALVVRFAPLVDVNERCMGFVRQLRRTILIHIDRIREADVKLRARERQYRAVFERSFDGILMTSTAGQIFAANPAACELLGYTESELQALERSELLASPLDVIDAALETRRNTGLFTGELEYRKKDGSTIVCDVTSVSYDSREGTRSILLFRDATQRKQSAERSERSARLEAVGQLTGGIAHDFNNLLQIIIGASEDLLASLDDQRDRDNASLIFSTSLTAADLVRQLLAFSRQQSLDAKAVSASKIVRELDQIIDRGTAGNVDIHFALEADDMMLLDPAQLESAIINLVINARDAVDPHGGEIRISTQAVEIDAVEAMELECQPGRYVRISVSDTGAGIDPSHLKRVIEPFFTTKESGKGTGLGLSMVFGFVRQSGGALKIQSEPGKGTTVDLFFPVSGEVTETLEIRENPASLGGGGEKILLVDDNQMLAEVLVRILNKSGYDCSVALTAEEALEKVANAEERPDLLITDVDLGRGIDGWRLINKVRETLPALPAIVMSGYDPTEGRGMHDKSIPFIRKPFRSHVVNEVVARVLAER